MTSCACGTDGSYTLAEPQIALVLRATRAVAQRVGIPLDSPFRNFAGFRSYWNREGASGPGGWQARRDLLDQLFMDAFRRLEDLETHPRRPELPQASLAALREPAAIHEQLGRTSARSPTIRHL
jgi:hypothetical protein